MSNYSGTLNYVGQHFPLNLFQWILRLELSVGKILEVTFQHYIPGAVKSVFPNSSIHLCLFHLVRNMTKQISELGLIQVILNPTKFKYPKFRGTTQILNLQSKQKMIKSQAFLPIQDTQTTAFFCGDVERS